MLARVTSAAVLGIDAYLVDVEVDLANGLPSFATVGLPQGAVREGRERVCAAIQNAGLEFPLKRITVNLAPADVPKQGSAFDLPIALGVLAAAGSVDLRRLGGCVVLGELGLEGDIRPVRGALSMAAAAARAGLRGLVLPSANLSEAAVVAGIEVRGATRLSEVVSFLRGTESLHRASVRPYARASAPASPIDFAEVHGQAHARRALEVAAAGAHNVLMVGPPGSGKTMLARRLPTILPALTIDEAIETTKVHSVAGLLPHGLPLVEARPFRAPHHTVSDAGLIGGGSWPRPGEVSLAHHGVLFLDELPEFRRNVLEALRQPLEDGSVTLSRAATAISFPARFTLAAAMNPCPCGHYGDGMRQCRCRPQEVRRYLSRVSGPLLDRVDLHIEVPAVRPRELGSRSDAEPSEAVRERVGRARERQLERFEGRAGRFANAHLTPREVREHCRPTAAADALLRTALARLALSARAYHRVLRISRTIADLAGAAFIEAPHVSEAVQYRGLDRAAGAAA